MRYTVTHLSTYDARRRPPPPTVKPAGRALTPSPPAFSRGTRHPRPSPQPLVPSHTHTTPPLFGLSTQRSSSTPSFTVTQPHRSLISGACSRRRAQTAAPTWSLPWPRCRSTCCRSMGRRPRPIPPAAAAARRRGAAAACGQAAARPGRKELRTRAADKD